MVKRGRDKKTGQDVAIKVQYAVMHSAGPQWMVIPEQDGGSLMHEGSTKPCADSAVPRQQPPALQVVDKSRYSKGDNSLQREIQVLCKVRHGS